MHYQIISFVLLSFIASCSSETNLFRYISIHDQKQGADLLISEAEHLYDKGKYQDALTLADQAKDYDPTSEKVAVVLGYIHLSLAGLDTFAMAKNASSGSSLTLADNTGLDGMASLIGLTEADYEAITLPNNEVTVGADTVKGAPTTGPFVDYPVLLPKTAPEARLSAAKSVYHAALAVKAICPFVDEIVKVLETGVEDPRHTVDVCEPIEGTKFLKAKSHYLWSLAHLTEAIVFNKVVLYNPSGEGTNLVRRSDALANVTGIADYINGMKELSTAVDVILPTEATATKNSMLTALFNDMEAATRGFSSIPGIPPSLTKSITDSMADINAQKAKLGGANDASTNAGGMKGQLTKGLSTSLQAQITARNAASPMSAAEKTEVCDSYSSISSDEFTFCS
ncbi:MAG: hypothetical protein CMP10_10530 [Zetaproteobacteria bacterium]|nr:hypothetical protein [Pseudobdellovibrionaceae bacterium]